MGSGLGQCQSLNKQICPWGPLRDGSLTGSANKPHRERHTCPFHPAGEAPLEESAAIDLGR